MQNTSLSVFTVPPHILHAQLRAEIPKNPLIKMPNSRPIQQPKAGCTRISSESIIDWQNHLHLRIERERDAHSSTGEAPRIPPRHQREITNTVAAAAAAAAARAAAIISRRANKQPRERIKRRSKNRINNQCVFSRLSHASPPRSPTHVVVLAATLSTHAPARSQARAGMKASKEDRAQTPRAYIPIYTVHRTTRCSRTKDRSWYRRGHEEQRDEETLRRGQERRKLSSCQNSR